MNRGKLVRLAAVLGLVMLAGCRSTATTLRKSGVNAVESAPAAGTIEPAAHLERAHVSGQECKL